MIHLVLIIEIVLSIFIVLLVYAVLFIIGYFIWERFCRYYKNWKIKKRNRRWEKKCEESMQRQHKWELKLIAEELKRKLHEKEKRKYPLFFWKENI